MVEAGAPAQSPWAIRRRTGQSFHLATAGALLAIVGLIGTIAWAPRPKLVWNSSPSSPVGLYRIEAAGQLTVGTMVIAWPPQGARRLGAARHYFPANVPLVKAVAAVTGDRVCARGKGLFVNNRLVARRRADDRRGRPMPWWRGCETLRRGDLLLLMMASPDSFDGRYFGISRHAQIIGRARLIWAG